MQFIANQLTFIFILFLNEFFSSANRIMSVYSTDNDIRVH